MWYKLKKIYIYPDGVTEKQVYPAWWKPWENTLLYLPLESDVVDKSWQATARTFTTNNISYTTVGWVPSIHLANWWWLCLTSPEPLQSTITNPLTISVLVYITTGQTSKRRVILDMALPYKNRLYLAFKEDTSNIQFWNQDTDIYWAFTDYINNWMHIVITGSVWNPFKMYINWNLVTTWWTNATRPWGYWPNNDWAKQRIFNDRDLYDYTNRSLDWNARELILEETEWTAQDVADYYTRIKSKLWI